MIQFYYSLFLLALSALTLLVSCQESKKNKTVIIQITNEKTALLNDSICRISEVGNAINVGADSTILYSDKIYLMVDSTVKTIISSSGEAPGKFIVCSAPCVHKDTLFILDAIGGKILAFNLRTTEFLANYKSPYLRDFETLYRYNGTFYGVKDYLKLALEKKLTPETPLISSILVLGDSLIIKDLPFKAKDAHLSLVERLPAGNPFKMVMADNSKPHIFYFNLGFSKSVWQYNAQSGMFQMIDIVLDQPNDYKIRSVASKITENFEIIEQDARGEIKNLIMSMEVPMSGSIFGDTLMIVSKYFAKYDYIIRMYSISQNKLLAEGYMSMPSTALSIEAVHILDKQHIRLLEVSKEANAQYPYTIVTKRIALSKL
jgi:hypothetical protein